MRGRLMDEPFVLFNAQDVNLFYYIHITPPAFAGMSQKHTQHGASFTSLPWRHETLLQYLFAVFGSNGPTDLIYS